MGAQILPMGAYHVLSTLLSIWETSMNETDKESCFRRAYILTRNIKTLQISFGLVLIAVLPLPRLLFFFFFLTREAQEFVEKYEGALGKGKGKRLYACKMLIAKVGGTETAKPLEVFAQPLNLDDHHRPLPSLFISV